MEQAQLSRKRFPPAGLSWMIAGALAFALLKYGGWWLVRWLAESGRTGLLSTLLSVPPGDHPVSFYIGWAEEMFLGPASQVAAFLTLAMVCLRHLSSVTFPRFLLAIFIFFLLTKPEVLVFPPYGDAIGGPFAEAIWLKDNGFNYAQLLQQPDYAQGGPRVYVFSVFPGYLALWMKLIPSPVVCFAVMHLAVFLMVAAVAAMLREVFRRVFPEDVSALAAVLFLSVPLVQAQAEAINMEGPCLFFLMLSAYFLCGQRLAAASLAAAGAVLVKGTGIVACGAVGVYALGLIIRDLREHRVRAPAFICLVLMAVVTALSIGSKFFLGDAHVSGDLVGAGKGWPSLRGSGVFYAVAVSLGIAAYAFVTRKKWWTDLLSPTGVMFLFGVMYFLVLFNFGAFSPRYRLSAYPFTVFCVFTAVSMLIGNPVVWRRLMFGSIAVAAAASYGLFYGPAKDHVILERSLEYRNDLRVDRGVVKRLEEQYAAGQIVAPLQLAQALALPELGYVRKRLDVVIYGFPCRYGGIRNYPGLQALGPGAVFVGKRGDIDFGVQVLDQYPFHPTDAVLEEVSSGDKSARIFTGGGGIERVYRTMVLRQVRKKAGMAR